MVSSLQGHSRLVPQFQDKDLDSYFVNFEHTATTLGWPSDKWPILLSTVLQGKAQITYAALSVADKCSYEKTKMAILQAYEHVPEAYRQSFRNLQKGDDQTYVEFAKEKQQCFERWCRSREVNGFDSLQNLILLEDFKDNIPHSVRVHLDDLDVVDMQTAARKADDYAVTHKLSTPNRKEVAHGRGHRAKFGRNTDTRAETGTSKARSVPQRDPVSRQTGGNNSPRSGIWCDYHRSPTHSNEQCYRQGRLPKDSRQTVSLVSHESPRTVQRDKSQKKDQHDKEKRPVSLTVSSPGSVSYNGVRSQLPKLSDGAVGQKSAHIDPRFRDFISYGAVATPNVSESSVPEYITVSILRDTGSSQSLIKKGVLDVQPRHYTGQSVLVSGISGESLGIPLYKVRLESDLLYPRNQEVVIGIADNLPVRGVQVLIGNDLAGPRVQTEPVVSEVPVTSASTEVLETDYANCLPSCVVTRAQAQSQRQKSQGPFREQSNAQQRFDLDLSETFFGGLVRATALHPSRIDRRLCA